MNWYLKNRKILGNLKATIEFQQEWETIVVGIESCSSEGRQLTKYIKRYLRTGNCKIIVEQISLAHWRLIVSSDYPRKTCRDLITLLNMFSKNLQT